MYKKEWNAGGTEQRYYQWLTGMIARYNTRHSRLIQTLYDTPFRVQLILDENRVEDGLGLRYRFAWETGMSRYERDILDKCRPCSVLELMLALALRCEEEYFPHYDEDYPIELWVGPMIDSLGFAAMDDDHWDENLVNDILDRFLSRNYSPDGRGSLFFIPGTQEDMRQTEIWKQTMMWMTHKGGEQQ